MNPCVCVWVCMRERERGGEGERESFDHSFRVVDFGNAQYSIIAVLCNIP